VTDEVAALEGLSAAMLVRLGEGGVKTLDDLGDLAGDELVEMLGDLAPSEEEANAIIMAARAHWFENEPQEAPAEAEPAGAAGTGEPAAAEPAAAAQTTEAGDKA
jgi:N utilization substance protein A